MAARRLLSVRRLTHRLLSKYIVGTGVGWVVVGLGVGASVPSDPSSLVGAPVGALFLVGESVGLPVGAIVGACVGGGVGPFVGLGRS